MLKMRLSMGGTKKRPVYKIVVADSRFPRDGRFIEKVGWLAQGAHPTTRVARLLGENEIMPMPAKGNNPQKAIPKKDRKKTDEGGEAKADATKTEAPKEEAKTEAPKEEAKTEAPKEEAKTEAPKEEAK